MYFVYIIFSTSHNRYYIGQTQDFDDRIVRHNSGYEKSTSPYRPWVLQCLIAKASRSEAMLLEKKLKNLNRQRLELFIDKYGGRDEAWLVSMPTLIVGIRIPHRPQKLQQ